MKISCILFTILFSFSLTVSAQSSKQNHPVISSAVNPADAGMSAERLGRIDKMLNSYIDSGAMNGAVAMIVHNGKIAYYKAFGYDDPKTKAAMKKDAIFRIASQTKAITSVAVMMLYEEGKFMLDDPISRYIPEFKNPKVIDKFNIADTTYTTIDAKREVTIRDLLTHTAGLGYAQIGSPEAKAFYAKAGIPAGIGIEGQLLSDKMKKLASLPLFHQPGEKYLYGLNTDMLGYFVEVISGIPLDKFFQQRIFEPLGMKDTYFYLPKSKYDRLVNLYTTDEKTGKAVIMPERITITKEFIRDFPRTEGTYFSGGGGLSSTVYDYAIFLQMMLNGGEYNGRRLLARNTVRMMTVNQIGDIPNGSNNRFGLGFGLTTEKGAALLPTPIGVFEWAGMFASTYWADPKEKIIGLIFRNIWPTKYSEIPARFKVLVYQAIND